MGDWSISRYSTIDHMICSPEIEVDGYMLTHPHQDGGKEEM